MDSYRDKDFVDNMERLFLMNTFPLDEVSPKKIEGPIQFDFMSEPAIQTVHEITPRSKQQRSAVDVPFLFIREPHHDFQAFGDTTDGSLSRMEIQASKASSALITDGKFTTPGLKLVVDKLQILDDNLRQIEEVVEEHGNLMEMIQQKPEAALSKGDFLASETGDCHFSQEALLQHNHNDEGNGIKLSELDKLSAGDDHAMDLAVEKPLNNSAAYHELDNFEAPHRKESIQKLCDKAETISENLTNCGTLEKPSNAESKETKNEQISALGERFEELKFKDVREVQSGLSLCKSNLEIKDETDIVDSEIKRFESPWKNPLVHLASKFSDIETSSDAVQNVLAATVCVLVVMCFIDNLAA